MRAILVNPDQSLRWDCVDDPVMKPDEVLVKILAAAVNRADLMQRAGDYPPPPGCPEWMGLEIAGEIMAMGKTAQQNSPFRRGDRVCALLGGGGYAQFANIRYDMLMPVPEGISVEEAAAIPEAFATAYLNLFEEGGLKAGQTLLMQAGASGLASVVIPMAKAFGARVITTVLQDEKAEAIRHLHADRIVVTDKENLVDVLREECEAGRPVDLVIDCLGGQDMGKCLPYLQRWGKWIMIATLAGDITQVDLKNLYVRNIRLVGSTLRARTPECKAALLASLVQKVWPKVTSGEVRPTIWKVMPVAEAEQAHSYLQTGASTGKIVLTVPHD